VTEHHRGGENHGGGVGDVLTHDVLGDVTAPGLEEGELSSDVGSRDNTGTSDESGTDVGNDRTVKVGHDHDIELLGSVDKLHRGVVDAARRES
jgi:hypothetical protein